MAPPGACAAEGERLVGVATEAGIWRSGRLYRQTWLSGANPHRVPLRVEIEVRFDGGKVGHRTYLVPSRERWAVNLDDVYGDVRDVMVNATVLITCDRDCAAERAIYYAPIGQDAPSVSAVPFVCAEGQ